MSLAKVTIMSLNNYLVQVKNETLFDELTLPEGIDKETLVDNIMLQGGEFECLYVDPDFLRFVIGMWGKKCYNTFLKWITAQQIEYNPLENYDRQEHWTDDTETSARRDSGNTKTFNNQDKRTIDTDTTSEEKVSAFDSSEYQPSTKTQVDNGGTDTMDYSGTIKDEYGEGASGTEGKEHDGRIHGNVGVTTSQQMLQQEYDIARFNIIDQITDMFILEFTIPVYD